MSEMPEKHPSETVGILYAGAAFSLWGIVPLYWDYLSVVPPINCQFTACCGVRFRGGVTIARGRVKIVWTAMLTKKLLMPLALRRAF